MSDGEQVILRGWIKPCDGRTDVTLMRDELSALGVNVGIWDLFAGEFRECEVSMTALENLDPLWGKYIWGLI